jgi:hypothetical protein
VGIELFERAVAGGGQLLRAETAPLGAGPSPVAVLALTFDVGRIEVRADPAAAALAIDYVESADQLPDTLEDASEEEPWWRVLGSPLARAWPAGPDHPGAVCIQFRGDDQNPRIVTLQPRGAAVAIRLENPPA